MSYLIAAFLNSVASKYECATIQLFTLIALAWQASRQKFFLITTYKPSSPTSNALDIQFGIALLFYCRSKQDSAREKSQI